MQHHISFYPLLPTHTQVYGDDTMAEGDDIEVKNIDEGFENSWSSAVVKEINGDNYTVEYSAFVDEDGKMEEESGLPRKRLRLAPPPADKDWAPNIGEIVEVNEDDCWWEAFVESVDNGKLKVKFRVSDEIKSATLGKKVRPCSWLVMEK